MKMVVIILGLAAAGLAFGLYKRNASANAEFTSAVTLHQSLSNQVAELRTKLALEQGRSRQTVSNLDYLVQQRDASLTYTSNRLVQASLLRKSVEAQAREAQEKIQAVLARTAVLEEERDQLERRLAGVATSETRNQVLASELTEAKRQQVVLKSELARLEFERSDLARKLDDVGFLRVQLSRAEEEAELKRRLVRSGVKASVSSKARLELQADGTVRPLLPTNH